jgi:hypothetical protein
MNVLVVSRRENGIIRINGEMEKGEKEQRNLLPVYPLILLSIYPLSV